MEQQVKVIDFPQDRRKNSRNRDRLNAGKKGRVYSRGNKLWVDFYYLDERVRGPSGLEDTPENRVEVRRQLDLVVAEIENGVFEFAKIFPHSRKKDYFTLLEGKTLRKEPDEVLFREYAERWMDDMRPGMSSSQIRDYTSILKVHHLPYFGNTCFRKLCSTVRMKKFVAQLKGKRNRSGELLSGKRIQNVMIILRVIVRDALKEYDWHELRDPFNGLKLPKARKLRVRPFSFEEWMTLMEHMPPWYRPYFEFAVQTGLRPSEQVALKWCAIDEEYIHIELSRVRNREKAELKTAESRRRIDIRPSMREVLESQRELAAKLESPYVFVNTHGRPILQDKLRELWMRVMKKSGLPYRRMYETRHTFASWALAAGETPEWVARTLGHVDTSMVYRTYDRYIPNLKGRDGSAFETQYVEATK